MEKTTSFGVRYQHIMGAAIITNVVAADINNATDEDDFVNVSLRFVRTLGEQEEVTDNDKRLSELGISAETTQQQNKVQRLREVTALVNAALFDNGINTLEEWKNDHTLVAATGIWVDAVEILKYCGYSDAVSIVNESTGNTATSHKRGYFQLIDDCETFVVKLLNDDKQRFENGDLAPVFRKDFNGAQVNEQAAYTGSSEVRRRR